MIPLEINFTTYIPTTLLGLLGLISGYLFFYFKNKNDNKLKEIKSASSKDRIKAIEMSLNELGVTIDTSNLDAYQKFDIVKSILKTKTNRFLITSLTAIIIAILVTFLIWNNNYKPTSKKDIPLTKDSIINIDTQEIKRYPQINVDSIIKGGIAEDIQDSLNNLPSISDSTKIIKDGPGGLLMLFANVKFQYSNGKIYYEITQHDSRNERYYYHLEIEILYKNNNIIERYKTNSYQTKFTPKDTDSYWLDFKYEMPSIEKSKELAVKFIKIAIYSE